MNSHFIHGRLARDPEFTQGSEPTKDRCNFTVATDRRYGDEADFFDCVIFGKRAGVVDKYFSKGSEIVLIGEGQIRSYEDKNGVKRRSYSVVASNFDFCGSKRENQNQSVSDVSGFEPNDDDIPF